VSLKLAGQHGVGFCRTWDLDMPIRSANCPQSTEGRVCLHGVLWTVQVQDVPVGPELNCRGWVLAVRQPGNFFGNVRVLYLLGSSDPHTATAGNNPVGRYYLWLVQAAGGPVPDASEFPAYIDVTDNAGEECEPDETVYYRQARLCINGATGFTVGDRIDAWITEEELSKLLVQRDGACPTEEVTPVFKLEPTGQCVVFVVADEFCEVDQPSNTSPFDPPSSTPGTIYTADDFTLKTSCSDCNPPPPVCDNVTWFHSCSGFGPWINTTTPGHGPMASVTFQYAITSGSLSSIPSSGTISGIPTTAFLVWSKTEGDLVYRIEESGCDGANPTCFWSITNTATGETITSSVNGDFVLLGEATPTITAGSITGQSIEIYSGGEDGTTTDFDSGADVTITIDNVCSHP
jgi:hypothetical protein